MPRLSRTIRATATIICIAAGLVLAGTGAARSGADSLGPPPLSANQTWLGTFELNDHIYREGDKVVATVKVLVDECFLIKGQCVGQISWSGLPFAPGKPCPGSAAGTVPPGTPTLRCVGKAGAATNSWMTAGVDFSNPTGTSAPRSTYYVILGKDEAVIEGHVTNRDGGGVAGVDVRAYKGTKLAYSATSGVDGYYMMRVKPGSYQVVPRGGPQGKKKPVYKPAFRDVSVAKGKNAHASFDLEAGLEVSISFATGSTRADGLHVVTGKVTVREYGKPKPNASVQLEAMPTMPPDRAVSGTTPRVTVCSATAGRVWPTGTLAAPVGSAVNVTTDDKGIYSFSLTIGTVPGTWTLRAWGLNSLGGLSLEESDASDDASITLTPAGNATTNAFVTSLAILASAGKLPSSGTHTGLRDDLVRALGDGSLIGGLSFHEVVAPSGGVIVSPAARPPIVNSRGIVQAPGSLVIAFGAWTGAGLPAGVANVTSLAAVIQGGRLRWIPTFSQYSSGAAVVGWNLANMPDIGASSTDFSSFGWAYRGVAGGCS